VVARRLQLQPALGRAVSDVGVTTIDKELRELVTSEALNHVASLGLRGERAFPVPSILEHAPSLIGYYRMLLGISKKEFSQANKLGYGPWLNAEERGVISARLLPDLPHLCEAFIEPLIEVVYAMDVFDDRDLSDLTLLTLGSTLQGGRNNVIGSRASRMVFEAIKTLVPRVVVASERRVLFETSTGHRFTLEEGTDPDVRLDVITESGEEVPVIAIEIKGGEDASNAYNRAGEAEKSHIKAQEQGFDHRWTIMVMRGLDRDQLRRATPSSTELFEAAEIMAQVGTDWDDFRRKFAEVIGEPSP
jgi:hypothetical protein